MNYKLVSIETNSKGIESVTGRLYTLDIAGVEIKEEKDKVFIKTCIEENCKTEEILKDIKESMNALKDYDHEKQFGSLFITVTETCDNDWQNTWKKYYKPTKIGHNVVIVPEWEEYNAQKDDIIVKVEPGSAFGSGTHETTSLCIEFIENFVKSDTKVLDIGTGTGILAVTALKLGAESAVAVDIDEKAVETAKINAKLNGVDNKFTVFSGNLAEKVSGEFELITANIVADAIISLAPAVPKLLEKGGIFIASGIISKREEEVRKALCDNGFDIFENKHKKDWAAFAAKLK